MVARSELSCGRRGDAIQLLASKKDCSDVDCPSRCSRKTRKKGCDNPFGENLSVYCAPKRALDQIPRPRMEFYGRGLFTAYNLHDSHAVRIADRTSIGRSWRVGFSHVYFSFISDWIIIVS